MALHRADKPAFRLAPGLLEQGGRQQGPEQEREQDDHQRTAHELGHGELPSDEQGQDDPELDHEVGRGELEGHGRGEVGALAEDRASEGDRGVRAGGGGGAKPARDGQGARGVVGQQPCHLGLGDDGLDDGREGKPDDQCPQDLPEHPEGDAEGVDDPAADRTDHGRDRGAHRLPAGGESQFTDTGRRRRRRRSTPPSRRKRAR